MKRSFCILLAMLAVMGVMVVPAFATEETVAETAEAVTEETILEETIPEDVAEVIASATPEQIQHVKQYILAGLTLVDDSDEPFWEKVKNFIVYHIDAIAWLVAAGVFLLYFIGNRILKKSLNKSALLINNNAVEIAERSEQLVKEANWNREVMQGKYEEAMARSEEVCRHVLAEARELKEITSADIQKLKDRETAAAEALSLMAVEINSLLQVSSLPEWERDRLQATFDAAKAKVEEVMRCDREGDGKQEA